MHGPKPYAIRLGSEGWPFSRWKGPREQALAVLFLLWNWGLLRASGTREVAWSPRAQRALSGIAKPLGLLLVPPARVREFQLLKGPGRRL